MSKRRRERDRPKAGPDALYHPNKRVLLSYASDDESLKDMSGKLTRDESLEAAISGHDPAVQHNDTTVVATETGEDEEASQDGDEDTDPDLEDESEHDQPPKQRRNPPGRHAVRRNDTTGQMAALGSLSYQWEDGDEDDDEEYDSEAEDAMSYLRAVRYERQNLPMVLRAPPSEPEEDIYDNGIGDTRGYLDDGAYVASASLGPHLPPTARSDIEPQEAFNTALKRRFLDTRESIHLPIDASCSPGEDSVSYSPTHNKVNAGLVRKTFPKPAQIRAMKPAEALRLLNFIRTTILVRGVDIAQNVSVWIWSLLAKLDDVGNMNNDQVSQIRELGKQAILVQLSFTDPSAAEQVAQHSAEDEVADEVTDPDVANEEVAGVVGEDPKVVNAIDDTPDQSIARQNTMATLDTIIALVGDVFRQRDLLEFRQSWDTPVENAQDAEEEVLP